MWSFLAPLIFKDLRCVSDFSPEANKAKSQKEIDAELYEYHLLQGHMAFNAENWNVGLEHYIKANRHNSKSCIPVAACAGMVPFNLRFLITSHLWEKRRTRECVSRLEVSYQDGEKAQRRSASDFKVRLLLLAAPLLTVSEFARIGRTQEAMKNYLEAQKAFTEAYMYNYGDDALEKLHEIEHEKLKVEIQMKKYSPEVRRLEWNSWRSDTGRTRSSKLTTMKK